MQICMDINKGLVYISRIQFFSFSFSLSHFFSINIFKIGWSHKNWYGYTKKCLVYIVPRKLLFSFCKSLLSIIFHQKWCTIYDWRKLASLHRGVRYWHHGNNYRCIDWKIFIGSKSISSCSFLCSNKILISSKITTDDVGSEGIKL